MHHRFEKRFEHKMRRFMRRHGRHGHGFGHFRGLAGGFAGGMKGLAAGRKLASGDLQLIILALLAEAPRHGYEIIKALEERSGGFYVPSPGMVYPALTYVEEIGHATVEADGNKKLYRITDAGSLYLAEHREGVDFILAQMSRIGRKMDRVRRAFDGDDTAREGKPADDSRGDREGGGRGDPDDLIPELHQARRDLRIVLREKFDATPDEQKRVAEILREALNKIEAK
ncbi:MAG: PadR family transcriptional regulator [Alphaproteobacteria bacterium]